MNENKRRLIDGWIEKAFAHLQTAEEQVKSSYRVSEAIQAAQTCVELSVKTALSILEIDYPPSHGWNEKQLRGIAEQIEKRCLLARLKEQHLAHINLPRLLILANFWDQFYIQAKYGIEAGNLAPAQELFQQPEAELAVAHARECHHSAGVLRHAGEDRLVAILTSK
jgi:HEPN domain-containing protein